MKIFFGIFLCVFSAATQAKNLYVATSNCSDATSYSANTENLPWCTLGRAVWGSTNMNTPDATQAAQAGDTVLVAAGIYTTSASTDSRYIPIYNPVNSGAPGLPITIRAQRDAYLRASVGQQPIIGTLSRSYVVWDGFVLNETYIRPHADTGPLVVWDSHHVAIQNMHITGAPPGYADNHNGIRVEASYDITISNNRIQNYNDAQAGMNDACFTAYDSYNVVIEHNECSEAITGFFIKGDHPDDNLPLQAFTLRYNYLHDVQNAIQFGGNTGDSVCSNASQVYQNLIVNTSLGGVIFIGYNDVTPACVTVANNTFIDIGEPANNNEAGGILLRPGYTGYRGLKFHNNLITDSASGVASWSTQFNATTAATTFSHNNYYNNYAVAFIAYTARTLTEWRTTYGKDITGTTVLNPQYRGANDYRLTNTSPLLNAGLDVLDLDNDGNNNDAITMGAYITGNEIIGITSNLPAPYPAPPMPPSNFTIQVNY